MLNNITVVGRLTKHPEIYDKEGRKRATFTVAVERNYRDKNNQPIVDFLFCKAFGKLAENIEHYLKQGSLVGITGQLHSSKYDKEGQTHFISEINIEYIKFMSSPKSDNTVQTHTSIIESYNPFDNPDPLTINPDEIIEIV
ncbi:single-stranded DNA-binding protein [Staphylococcus pettenkoferi]|uniref:Single-stranded DNA-binding protein n=1 Tax=Staphylococcus pettenkoferi TaxID=170573 RepID=A0ABT4BI09_9STAP|nr:single-stranded DNA-binding protein [Staphylococcus pettenkoferi]MCY1565424.1 single-stranded DNA-binding protein [Staphylococcus pettenkoferi]MCY1570886.1 single-stranded DNA-binding protein [Staphylococcus pettenkoferi]MCY1582308.1 single-stranded DNA-binding protein [Staphylococcus pettenkoferi]MCY1590573.1 single-stranded DNA-binding protein [Staphylococcus pettenkoferi]MCY1599929.1 single-stranded DNA-binding protein [Staphylococcus pettenkoferi]